tara:strand:+ start:2919 stop:4328 length:1410 start_codon:yes stop_codon:yes gene_type:complete
MNMRLSKYIKKVMAIIMCCGMSCCEDFVDLDAPDHKIVSEVVFASDETANSAMTGIYNQLFIAPFSRGWMDSVTVLTGLASDELHNIWTTNLGYMEFEQNEILPTNSNNLGLWSSAYNIIYMTNALLEGLENSDQITDDVRYRLEGEAKFVRAFSYFYLVNLYGDVPLLLSTDYRVNALASRNTMEEVYQQLNIDLENAINLLDDSYTEGERTHANRYAATSLLARVNLYLENWEQAENLSSEVLAHSDTYQLLEDLDQVFLANSKEAIWQLSPIGRGSSSTQTNEGNVFIIDPIFSAFANLKLSEDFVGTLNAEDKRLLNWVGYHDGTSAYYAYKYKIWISTASVTEYSMVLRLAEQYLIRAESRARQGNLMGAIADVDIIRKRAGLELLADTDPGMGKDALLQVIFEERRKELFTEWGHRWFDLKRSGQFDEVLGPNKSFWDDTDILFPIPEEERMKNTNLGQNPGY